METLGPASPGAGTHLWPLLRGVWHVGGFIPLFAPTTEEITDAASQDTPGGWSIHCAPGGRILPTKPRSGGVQTGVSGKETGWRDPLETGGVASFSRRLKGFL